MSNTGILIQKDTTFEGTWEEVSRHAGALTGKRLRVTVLGEAAEPISLDEQERLLDELAARHSHLPAPPEDAFTRESIYAEHD